MTVGFRIVSAVTRAPKAMIQAFAEIPTPLISDNMNRMFGGGAGLAAACDMAIAGEGTNFSFSEARLGLVAATISPYVVQAIGPRNARGLFATARVFDAAYAEKIGLITQVVPDVAALEAAAVKIAGDILACGPEAVAGSKRLVDEVAGRPINRDLMELTAHRIASVRVGDEGQEGVRAFLERRKPRWAE